MLQKIAYVALFLVVFGLGFWIANRIYADRQEQQIRSQSTVLLEKVQQVCKLVTVEGQFSELYDETRIRQMTFYLPLPTTWNFSKQAIIQVNGRVLVGYDMEKVRIDADSTSRTLTISNLPEPEILAIDHDISYKNIEESYFNSFTPEDYTKLNKNAKEVLRNKAEESRLLDEARRQGNQMIDVIRYMAESVGWRVVLEDPLLPGDVNNQFE
ncbi:MAG: DUF4230 domain-containing protein [Saprospiraceae bacterium]|nr:DUF4230 domain-containing protein [Saprospiraceae bacterium]